VEEVKEMEQMEQGIKTRDKSLSKLSRPYPLVNKQQFLQACLSINNADLCFKQVSRGSPATCYWVAQRY
jgi:hypothetical protein